MNTDYINLIPEFIELGPDEAKTRLLQLGLTAVEADQFLSSMQAGIGRAHLLNAGMKRSQFHGDFENDPVFQATLHHLVPKKNLWERFKAIF